MENMVVPAVGTVPMYQGVPLDNYPALNSGVFENQGYEIAASFEKTLKRDLHVYIGGSFSYAKNKVINQGEALRTEDYAYQKWQEGYSFGQEFGYLVDYSNGRSEEHTSELQSLMSNSYDVFCLTKK